MVDSLVNPIQSEVANVRIDLRPKRFYPNNPLAQSVTLVDGTIILVEYDGVLPYIPIRRPTAEEIDECRRTTLSSRSEWDPMVLDGSFGKVRNILPQVLTDDISILDNCSAALMSSHLGQFLDNNCLLHLVKNHKDSFF